MQHSTSLSSFKALEKETQEIEAQIAALRDKLVQLRRQEGEQEVRDYLLKDKGGVDVKLSSLFGESNELFVAHFMGQVFTSLVL
jgi:predicted dithiol-disulfide oxidoreductase (DUF899 family)